MNVPGHLKIMWVTKHGNLPSIKVGAEVQIEVHPIRFSRVTLNLNLDLFLLTRS